MDTGEPVAPDSCYSFLRVFGKYGLHPRVIKPAYGLAEV